MRPDSPPNPIDGRPNPIDGRTDRINQAQATIAFLKRVQDRVAHDGALYKHIEWAKEAAWAAAYPGSPDDTLLNGLDTEAEQAG